VEERRGEERRGEERKRCQRRGRGGIIPRI
jgi:hypothetical protein